MPYLAVKPKHFNAAPQRKPRNFKWQVLSCEDGTLVVNYSTADRRDAENTCRAMNSKAGRADFAVYKVYLP